MDKFWKLIGIIVVVLMIVAFFWTRFQVVQVNYAHAPAFYKVNRLTGQMHLIVGKEYVTVEKAEDRGVRHVPAPGGPGGPAPAPEPAQ
jgi:hypothetical protein